MRVLVLTPWFPNRPGDQFGNFIFDQAEALFGVCTSVEVLVTRPFGLFGEDHRHGRICVDEFPIPVHRLNYWSIPRNLLRAVSDYSYTRASLSRMLKMHKAEPFDVVLAHTELAGAAAVAFSAVTGVPVATVVHGVNDAPGLNTAKQRAYQRQSLNAAQRVILVGEPLHKHLDSLEVSHEHRRVIHNGFRGLDEAPLPRSRTEDDSLDLVSVSNLNPGKGIELTIQALSELSRRGVANWTYTIVGDGSLRDSLKAMVVGLGLREHISFLGAVANSDVPEILSRAHVFVLPSSPEAFGVAYLEAMAMGCVCIGVAGQGPSAFIADGETGYLLKSCDTAELAELLEMVISSAARTCEIAAAGQAAVRRDWTWSERVLPLAGELEAIAAAGVQT